MDPVLTDCYVWLYDQAEYVAMALHTWHQLGQVRAHKHMDYSTWSRSGMLACVWGATETVAWPGGGGEGRSMSLLAPISITDV